MDLLITGIGQLATADGPGPRRGVAQGQLRVVRDAAIAIRDGRVAWVGPQAEWRGADTESIDVGGAAVIPGLVDPHTHAIWAGDRLADFEARASAASYEAILAGGGGIRATVRATAAADVTTLVRQAQPRLDALLRSGATTIEVKSGYGFTPQAELCSLEAIARLRSECAAELRATYLAHIPPVDGAERAAYVAQVAEELIPTIAARELATAVDVFVEREAFTLEEAERILRAARAHGLAIKLHADQFHAIGGVELAVAMGAQSVDHLEASGSREVAALAASDTVATLLPGVSLHLGLAAAPGRALVDAGAAVAVATDLNPGTSPIFSTAMALALAVRLNGLTPAEALVAATANAAAALGLRDRGWLGAGGGGGARADLVILDADDWREITYAFGASVASRVFVGGREVWSCR